MIHLFDDDPRKNDPDYALNHGSFAAVHIGLNNALKKLGYYSEPDDAEHVGCCDGLKVNFKYKDKKSFLISVWEYQNCLTNYHIQTAYQSNQKIFGLSDQITNLWRKYNIPCKTVYGGCDTEFWQPTKEKNKDIFKFLHINSSNVRSGLDLTIVAFGQAFENNKDVQLHIKDTNDSLKLKGFIDHVCKKYNCNIFYESFRAPMTYIRDLYSESHVTLNLLRMTSFGMPLLDSVACGSLCVTGNIEPCNEIINSNIGVLIKPKHLIYIRDSKYFLTELGLLDCYPSFPTYEEPLFYEFDVDLYSKTLQNIYSYYSRYKFLIDNGKKEIKEKWSWENSAKQLIYGLKL